MPSPCPQNIAVAVANHMLNNQAAGLDDEDKNIDPLPRTPQATQGMEAIGHCGIVVPFPGNDKVTRDIEFQVDIPCHDFCDRIIASMNLDPATAQLGWKTSDEGKCAASHQLDTDSDIDNAFKTILSIQNNPCRRKEILMEGVHLNPAMPQAPKKKINGSRSTDSAYSAELRVVKEKLQCAHHSGPNRWCYVSPENPTEHVALGLEEITLWAWKIHDNDADADCVRPPHCHSFNNLVQKANRIRPVNSKSNVPPIHVHINNAPLGESSCHNIISGDSTGPGMKHTHSTFSVDTSDSDEESLPLADVLQDLN
ncbi:hypothetical protein CVT25_001996 [Psilocybe cyanescens]|uniref:Uncharacterized protein n=1 Tax=Psilocybe cyanescens TaxID=93625 RepID=A0A409X9A6_PSICY|nr:hypothetical protein CVT25_001996 [Psilocybe cyanescens]